MPPELADIVVQTKGANFSLVFPGDSVENTSRKRPLIVPARRGCPKNPRTKIVGRIFGQAPGSPPRNGHNTG
jgi:hypothetical protein